MAMKNETEQSSKGDIKLANSTEDTEIKTAQSSVGNAADQEQPLNTMTFKDDLGPQPFNNAQEENESEESEQTSRYFWIQKPAEEMVNEKVIEETVESEVDQVLADSEMQKNAPEQHSVDIEPAGKD